jgi:serine protease Do
VKKSARSVLIFVFIFSSFGLAQARSFDLGTIFIELGKKVDPAVVNIATTQIIHGRQGGLGGGGQGYGYPGMPMPNDPFRQFFEEFMGPQMQQAPEEKVQSLGSGFIIDSTGLIITNNHVIQGATEIQVQVIEGSKKIYKAKVVGADKRTDIALIKINTEKALPFVILGDSDKVQKGEWVAAFGNPFGYGHSETKGIISSKDRPIDAENASYPFLQTDASINPGNSGGPLVNTSAEVIGVNSAIDARAQGIGFAIPINIVKRLLPQLKTSGRIIHGYLGVGVNSIDDKMVKQFKLKVDHGAIVLSVSPGSPAESAGLRPYDIVTSINGKDVEGARELTNIIAETPVGNTVSINLIRDGKNITTRTRVVERPDEIASGMVKAESEENQGVPKGQSLSQLGMSVADLTPQLARELEIQDAPKQGVVITGIRQGGLAEQSGLQVGDVIGDVNRHHVETVKKLLKEVRRGTNSMLIKRGPLKFIVFMGPQDGE